MWILMLALGLAVLVTMIGFVVACERL